MTVKISRVSGTPAAPVEHAFAYENTYARQRVGGVERLVAGLRGGHGPALVALGAAVRGPYRLLCILHTTRVGAALGRYQSPELTAAEVRSFFGQFGPFFAQDARADVWLHAPADATTVVLDRYNLLYAYGPLDTLERVLVEGGARAVAEPDAPAVPRPHALHYHPEWDAAERDVLDALAWTRVPLRPADVQFGPDPQAT